MCHRREEKEKMLMDTDVVVGARVVINRSEGRDGAFGANEKFLPAGTEGTIVGCALIDYGRTSGCGVPPGIYLNPCWPEVRFDGEDAVASMSSCHLDLLSPLASAKKPAEHVKLMVRPLPDLPFWEEDEVDCGEKDGQRERWGKISHIYYPTTEGDEAKYDVELLDGGTLSFCRVGCLRLVRRGLVWHYYHNTLPVDLNLEDKADLYRRLGLVEQIRLDDHRYSGDFWAVLSSVKAGKADAMYEECGPHDYAKLILSKARCDMAGIGHRYYGYHYQDRELGEQVRCLTLEVTAHVPQTRGE
jgi:hypothetical protein